MRRPPRPPGNRPRARRLRSQQSAGDGWSLEGLVRELQGRVDAAAASHAGQPPHRWLYPVIDAWASERDDAWRRRSASASTGLPIVSEPACAIGCVHCCYQHVAVAGIEAMVLAGHARERWPAGEVEALRARVDREAPRLREIGPDPSALARIRRPCPMLDERLGLCRAYEARPVNCRRENSIDVEVCRRYREDPESNESSIRLVRYDVIWGAARVFLSRWSADLLDSDLDETMPMELALSLALAREPAPEAPNRAEAPREADRPDEP